MNGQPAALDGAELTSEQVKLLRDALKAELAKTQGSRDVNTVVVKAAPASEEPKPRASAASKGFSVPNVENSS